MIYLGNQPVGVGVGVHGVTAYKKVTATPTSNAVITFEHNLGIVPKFVLVRPAQDVDITDGKIVDYGIAGNFGSGGYIGISAGTYTYMNASHQSTSTTANSVFNKTATAVSIRQQSSSVGWDVNATYEAEIWA